MEVAGNLEPAKLLYSVEQAVCILELSRSELYREMARGHIRGIRIGRSRRFSREELERYVTARYMEASEGK